MKGTQKCWVFTTCQPLIVNANGSLLTEMATTCRICVASTFFKHTAANMTTWMSYANRIPRVIDHALVRQWSMRHVVDVRTAPSLMYDHIAR